MPPMTKLESNKVARQLVKAERTLDRIKEALKSPNPWLMRGMLLDIVDQYDYYDWDAETEVSGENDGD